MFRPAQQVRLSSSAKADDPVRRGLSIQSQPSVEYWVPAFAGTTITYNTNIAAVASSSHSLVWLSSRCGRTSRLTRVW